ncbi:UNVERIFIED_CONTAM: hypothetical protein RMT77_010096 [Armadillidium vulgare]
MKVRHHEVHTTNLQNTKVSFASSSTEDENQKTIKCLSLPQCEEQVIAPPLLFLSESIPESEKSENGDYSTSLIPQNQVFHHASGKLSND